MNQFKNKYFLIIVICMKVAFLSKGASSTLEHRLPVNPPVFPGILLYFTILSCYHPV